jgi:hypothetical protein
LDLLTNYNRLGDWLDSSLGLDLWNSNVDLFGFSVCHCKGRVGVFDFEGVEGRLQCVSLRKIGGVESFEEFVIDNGRGRRRCKERGERSKYL